MSFSTPPSAANASVTPPKTHSSGKWLANYDNPAKRVKTYESPSPIASHEENGKSQTMSTSPPKNAGTVPAFDFSPIDTFPQEIAQPAPMTQPEAGSYLSDLIQDNFGSNSALELDSSHLESNRSNDRATADNDQSPSKATFEIAGKNMVEAVSELTSDQTASHRQGSTNASIASDITVPNTFDSLFKDNMEFTMPEDTMRAGMLAAALDMKDRAALEVMSPVNVSHVERTVDTRTNADTVQAQPHLEFAVVNEDIRQEAVRMSESDLLTALPTEAAARIDDHKSPVAEDTLATTSAGAATTIASDVDATMKGTGPPIASPPEASEIDRIDEENADQASEPAGDPNETSSSAPPSTPVRRPRKTARTPQTAPKPTREPVTPLSRTQRPAPMTEGQAGRASRKSRTKPLAQVTETVTDEQASGISSPMKPFEDHKAEEESIPLVFKTPAKAGRGTRINKQESETSSQNVAGNPVPQPPLSSISEPDSTNTDTAKTDGLQISTPHSQELASAKRSVRRSSQRITDTPVSDPQPTPTKSSGKASAGDSQGFESTGASFSSPAAPRSSRSRQSDAPASIPKSPKGELLKTNQSLSPIPVVTDQDGDVLMESNSDEITNHVDEPVAENTKTPSKITSSPSIGKSTRKSTKASMHSPLKTPVAKSPAKVVSNKVEDQKETQSSVPSSRRSVRNRGVSQVTPIKTTSSDADHMTSSATSPTPVVNDEQSAEHFTVEEEPATEAKNIRGCKTRKATSAEPPEVKASPRSKTSKPVESKVTTSSRGKRQKADTSEAVPTTDDAGEIAEEEKAGAGQESVQKSTRGRRKAAEPVKEAPTKSRTTRKKADPATTEIVEPTTTSAKTKGISKAASETANAKAGGPRASKRKASARDEEDGEEAAAAKEIVSEDTDAAPAEPPTKKARGRRAGAAAPTKDPTPDPPKATRAKGAKNAVVASPKTTRGSARAATTRSTRSKK